MIIIMKIKLKKYYIHSKAYLKYDSLKNTEANLLYNWWLSTEYESAIFTNESHKISILKRLPKPSMLRTQYEIRHIPTFAYKSSKSFAMHFSGTICIVSGRKPSPPCKFIQTNLFASFRAHYYLRLLLRVSDNKISISSLRISDTYDDNAIRICHFADEDDPKSVSSIFALCVCVCE